MNPTESVYCTQSYNNKIRGDDIRYDTHNWWQYNRNVSILFHHEALLDNIFCLQTQKDKLKLWWGIIFCDETRADKLSMQYSHQNSSALRFNSFIFICLPKPADHWDEGYLRMMQSLGFWLRDPMLWRPQEEKQSESSENKRIHSLKNKGT